MPSLTVAAAGLALDRLVGRSVRDGARPVALKPMITQSKPAAIFSTPSNMRSVKVSTRHRFPRARR
jgi:hypothetical protein